ncbi:MAG: hypothetical protein IT307_19960, partial [Chloroflexi bacterium]|nr:hypothetical protein [Chloroflexota bacterium]
MPEPMIEATGQGRMDRRRFLRRVIGVGLGASVGSALLAACAPAPAPSP